jgi:hypothetical protein
MLGPTLLGAALVMLLASLDPTPVRAVEVGEPAPDFKLPSTHGVDIALKDFRGKKWIFLEFYGGDFHPT